MSYKDYQLGYLKQEGFKRHVTPHPGDEVVRYHGKHMASLHPEKQRTPYPKNTKHKKNDDIFCVSNFHFSNKNVANRNCRLRPPQKMGRIPISDDQKNGDHRRIFRSQGAWPWRWTSIPPAVHTWCCWPMPATQRMIHQPPFWSFGRVLVALICPDDFLQVCYFGAKFWGFPFPKKPIGLQNVYSSLVRIYTYQKCGGSLHAFQKSWKYKGLTTKN